MTIPTASASDSDPLNTIKKIEVAVQTMREAIPQLQEFLLDHIRIKDIEFVGESEGGDFFRIRGLKWTCEVLVTPDFTSIDPVGGPGGLTGSIASGGCERSVYQKATQEFGVVLDALYERAAMGKVFQYISSRPTTGKGPRFSYQQTEIRESCAALLFAGSEWLDEDTPLNAGPDKGQIVLDKKL